MNIFVFSSTDRNNQLNYSKNMIYLIKKPNKYGYLLLNHCSFNELLKSKRIFNSYFSRFLNFNLFFIKNSRKK